jgi:hypothetical protein
MKYLLYILFGFGTLMFTACEDVIEVKLNADDMNLYAVDAQISTLEEPYVFLYRGLPVTKDSAYAGVSGAVVKMTENSTPAKSVTLVESPEQKGFYTVPDGVSFKGIPGMKYVLHIEHEGVTLEGSESLAAVAPIDSIEVFPSSRGEKRFLAVFTYGIETPGKGNFYKWEIYVNNVYLSDLQYLSFADDALVDGNYISGLEIMTDFHDISKPLERELQLNDTIQVRQLSISPFTYSYFTQAMNQNSAGSLFSVPPANIKSNITASDGKPVLGLFRAHDVVLSNVVIIDESIENQLRK